jgi:membrane protein DedA with SNARE-associated domain
MDDANNCEKLSLVIFLIGWTLGWVMGCICGYLNGKYSKDTK